jgi:hypothetical protein
LHVFQRDENTLRICVRALFVNTCRERVCKDGAPNGLLGNSQVVGWRERLIQYMRGTWQGLFEGVFSVIWARDTFSGAQHWVCTSPGYAQRVRRALFGIRGQGVPSTSCTLRRVLPKPDGRARARTAQAVSSILSGTARRAGSQTVVGAAHGEGDVAYRRFGW